MQTDRGRQPVPLSAFPCECRCCSPFHSHRATVSTPPSSPATATTARNPSANPKIRCSGCRASPGAGGGRPEADSQFPSPRAPWGASAAAPLSSTAAGARRRLRRRRSSRRRGGRRRLGSSSSKYSMPGWGAGGRRYWRGGGR
jgi:hypothetical protein